jgi:geranylgeranylglycerol-phosphate geranylgeranyltransferase
MPPSPVASALALVRWKNLVLSAAGVVVGGTLALGRPGLPAELVWAAGSAMGLGAAGNAANDLFDVDADRVNRPSRPLASGALGPEEAVLIGGIAGGLGLFAAWWVGTALLAIAAGALVVMLAYSPLLKQHGLAGNLAVAVVASLPLVYGATSLGLWRAGLVPFALAALLHLAREAVKDLEDIPGDRAQGRRTVPIMWGPDAGFWLAALALILFVPAALAPWAAGWYGRRYGVAALALNVGVAVLIARLLGRRLEGARAALKAAMAMGLAALLWDRL